MSHRYIRADLRPGLNTIRLADSQAGELVDLYVWRGLAGEEVSMETEGKEFGLVVMSGLVDVVCGQQVFHEVGGRVSVFSGPAAGLWAPPGVSVIVKALSVCEVAICAAPSRSEAGPQLIPPAQVVCRQVGNWNWVRDVCTIIGDNVPQAQRLVVGETINLPGNWSSYPPHKHTQDDYPFEVQMEEVYHYRVNPIQGFGVQCLYNDDMSIREAYIIEDGDTVVIPPAYHPVAAAPGYQLYYLWVLAAYTDRRMRPRDDHRHAWVHAAGQMARGMGF
jgi:5-deoxy-glucuronate isomerase